MENVLLHSENEEVREGVQGIIGDGKNKMKYDEKFKEENERNLKISAKTKSRVCN